MQIEILLFLIFAALIWLGVEVRSLRLSLRRRQVASTNSSAPSERSPMSTHGPAPHLPKALPAAAVRHRAEDEAVARKTLALARQGVAFAQCSLGKLYQRGVGLSQDLEQAVYWYQAASQQGNSEAQFLLGLCRQEGKGVEKDDHEAESLFRGSATRGWAEAQYRLAGILSAPGRSLSDREESRLWLAKAAQQGHLDARRKLADVK